MDHDNDGVTDEDSDGAGAGRYDEDDDNDGRIDQFTWPCDLDSDGIPDYFDTDDDDDGTPDVIDEHPYDATLSGTMEDAADASSTDDLEYSTAVVWTFNQYREYSGGVDYVTWEQNRVNAPNAPASGFFGGLDDFVGDAQGRHRSPRSLTATLTVTDRQTSSIRTTTTTEHPTVPTQTMTTMGFLTWWTLTTTTTASLTPASKSTPTATKHRITRVSKTEPSPALPSLPTDKATATAPMFQPPPPALEAGSVDVTTTGGTVTGVSINRAGSGYAPGDSVAINGGNSNATLTVTTVTSANFEVPGADGNQDGTIDCEIDYDNDLDDDIRRPFDQNYNGIYDWLDTDMGGTESPDNLGNFAVGGANRPYDLDNDNVENENDSFPLDDNDVVATWNCPTQANPNPTNP